METLRTRVLEHVNTEQMLKTDVFAEQSTHRLRRSFVSRLYCTRIIYFCVTIKASQILIWPIKPLLDGSTLNEVLLLKSIQLLTLEITQFKCAFW